MTHGFRRSRARSVNVLASAALTLAALAVLGTLGAPRSHASPQQTPADPWEGSTFTAPSSFSTSSDAVFSGVFRHTPPAPIASVVLHVEFSTSDTPPADCRPAPADETMTYSTDPSTSAPATTVDPATSTPQSPTTPTTAAPQRSTEVQFSFHVPVTCNGVYDATATATIEDPSGDVPPPLRKSVSVVGVRVAIPPATPASIVATDSGNHTVTVSWGAPPAYTGAGRPPPDFTGYRVSRKDGDGSFAVIATPPPTALTFADSSIPPAGGSFVYEVESVRKFASSPPVVTDGALKIGGPAGSAAGSSGGGRAGGGAPATTDPGAGGTGTAYYDTTTLAADEGDEPGGDALSGVPGGGAIQRFAGHDGAGLLKPFAAALDLGVWAGLLLFLTRRAAKAERAALLAIQLEHASQ